MRSNMPGRWLVWLVVWLTLHLAQRESVHAADPDSNAIHIPTVAHAFVMDGMLDEACYRHHAPLENFVVACRPTKAYEPTKAWLFRHGEDLVVAFSCVDTTPAASQPTADEHAVDDQDRVEIFLWSGGKEDPYYCVEVSPSGAVHDYRARFYRQFDDAWSPRDLRSCVQRTENGYTVELQLSARDFKEALTAAPWREPWRVGLFRADFDRLRGEPTWITWVDPHTPQPDFHVADAFGRVEP